MCLADKQTKFNVMSQKPHQISCRPPGKGTDCSNALRRLRIEPSGVLAVLGSMKQPWAGATRAAATTWPGAFPNPERWQNLATGAGPDGMASTPGLPGGSVTNILLAAVLTKGCSQVKS